MASSLSSRITFYDESGAQIAWPVEGRTCGIVIDVPKELHSQISLKLDAELLPVQSVETAPYAYSVWPASGPGHYNLSLACASIREHLTITVVPEYFSETDFSSMLHDLKEVLPHSISAKLRRCGARVGVEHQRELESTLEWEWITLRDAVRGTPLRFGLLQILPAIQRECHQILLPRLEIRTTEKMRRPEMSRLPQAMTMPGNMIAEDELYQMFDVSVQQSVETYENQLVKSYVQAVRSQLSRLQTKMIEQQAPPAVIQELDALINEYRLAIMRATFLQKVRRPAVSADRVTMVLLKNPAYRAVLEGYLALNQQSTITLEEQALNAPLNKFPFLYQLWTNLTVLDALLQVCAEAGYQCASHHWVKSYKKGAFVQVINDGKPAVQLVSPINGTHVSLIPWRPITEGQDPANVEGSMALAVAIEVPGRPLAVLLFDPRYNVSVKSATGSSASSANFNPQSGMTAAAGTNPQTAHETNMAGTGNLDELVHTIEPVGEDVDELLRRIAMLREGGVEREIRYAALMYPGDYMQISPGIEALPARPCHGDFLQKTVWNVLRHHIA